MKEWYWVNNKTRKFLSQGYLAEGESVEDRVSNIGKAAQSYLPHNPEFYDKFMDYISRGWISLSSPIWANMGAGRGLPISCITGDMWINTIYGGKQAKNIKIGDEVLTHKGRFRKVSNVTVTKRSNDIYELKVNNRMTPLKITGNHLVMTNLGWIRVDKLDKNIHLVAINGDIEHSLNRTEVIELDKYCDYNYEVDENAQICKILTKKNQKRLSKRYSDNYVKINSRVEADRELMWALGIWFAEGSISTYKGKPNGIRITLDISEQAIAERWLSIIERKFQVKGKIFTAGRREKEKTWINVNVNSSVLGNYFRSFGANCKEKKLPNWVLKQDKEALSEFLNGLLTGDGTITSSDANRLTLSNPELILQVYLIGLILGLEMSLQMQEKPSKYNKTIYVYTIVFRKYHASRRISRSNAGTKFHDGLVYSTIASIKKLDIIDDVYDLTVDEDNSFSVAGVVVHNCNNSFVEDDMVNILTKVAEVGIMTKMGAGTSAYLGKLRPRGSTISSGGTSSGPVHFAELFETTTDVVSQSNVRRGSCAIYLPVEHPDIMEFLEIREEGHPIQHLSIGVCVTDAWLKEMVGGDKEKRKIWLRIIKKRFESGYPYIFFTDTVNNNKPQVYKDKNIDIYCSNLCSEINLPSSNRWSFVCDLSSVNLIHYDEWKSTDLLEVMVQLLDAVMSDYIEKTATMAYMEDAHNFAKEHRALGVGVLGWHSLLQSKMLSFESMDAKYLNVEIWKLIKEKTVQASRDLAQKYGEPELLKGYGLRNTTTMAVAPTTSSSFILGQVSPSVEPLTSNYFVKDLAKGKFTYKNPYLKSLLIEKDKDTPEIWEDILAKGGSVQHLKFLSHEEKDVFKTFGEISQKEVVIQAAQRQRYIDQSQSLNLMIHPKTPVKDVNSLLLFAWEQGVKTLYYQRSSSTIQELGRSLLECKSCEA